MKNKIFGLISLVLLMILTITGALAFSFRNMTLDFVHISDTHITDRQNTTYKALGSSKDLLKDAIEQINSIVGLDFVMFTGDLVDRSTEENFENYYQILSKLKYPSLNAFGNHDFMGDFTKDEVVNIVKKHNPNYTFNDTYYAFSPKTDFRIIVLDAVIKDRITSNGELSAEQLAFLDKELSENQDKVVIIAMHHPAIEPFIAQEHALLNANEFNEILLKYKNPIVILTGHYHATKLRRIGNLVYVSTPAMVTYPMAFRHIKITNYNDRVQYDFDFIPTRLDDVKEQNRQSVISYATLAGYEKDRNISFTFKKRHPKSINYKRHKIQQAAKPTKTSKREIKKLTQPPKVKKPNKIKLFKEKIKNKFPKRIKKAA